MLTKEAIEILKINKGVAELDISNDEANIHTYEFVEAVETVLKALTAYENTGLTPEEITQLTARVEAFERAIKKESLPGVLCRMCVKTECNDCNNGSDWQFDQERFGR